MKINLTLIILYLHLLGCQDSKDIQLNYALKCAGDNRLELEKVLTYYKNEPEKLKAAKFLIRNMPGHVSYTGKRIEEYYSKVDSLLSLFPADMKYTDSIRYHTQKAITKLYSQYSGNVDITPDIQFLSADFLIQNINQAFYAWKEEPWAKHLNFDQFCEYLLPYKIIELQPLENWRDSLKPLCRGKIDMFHYSTERKNSAFYACTEVNTALKDSLKPFWIYHSLAPIMKMTLLPKINYGTCIEYGYLATAIMRSKGIPVAIDYTPQWPNCRMSHTWNVVLTNNGLNVKFGGCDTHPGYPHQPDKKMAKVYRLCYALNPDIVELRNSGTAIPPLLNKLFMKDVTSSYMDAQNVEIRIEPTMKQPLSYAYACVFDNKRWVPIALGRKKRKSFVFKDLGKDIVYLAAYYHKNGLQPIAYPFLLNNLGKKEFFRPDTTIKQTLRLRRKAPVSATRWEFGYRIVNGKFEASNNPDFKNAVTVTQLEQWSSTTNTVLFHLPSKYRYWRYLSPDEGYCNIAEIKFFNENDELIKGKIISSEPESLTTRKEAAFDNDPLTYFESAEASGSWIGMDFSKPQAINKIIYQARNDDNNIREGDEYELFYWNGQGWTSMGKQTGKEQELIYTNVPVNALYVLRNYTRGHDERIFTYENDEQVWW